MLFRSPLRTGYTIVFSALIAFQNGLALVEMFHLDLGFRWFGEKYAGGVVRRPRSLALGRNADDEALTEYRQLGRSGDV